MAINCCICGTKIGLMDPSSSLSGEFTDMKICAKCINKKRELYYSDDRYKEATEYFSKYISSNQIDKNTINTINLWIKQAEDNREKDISARQQKSIEDDNYRNIIITTGDNLEGYRIKKYIGLVSGSVVLGTGFLSEFSASVSDFFGAKSNAFANKIANAKRAAQTLLMQDAVRRGGNAIIGVTFGYIKFTGDMVGISVDGTAVDIEKDSNDGLGESQNE